MFRNRIWVSTTLTAVLLTACAPTTDMTATPVALSPTTAQKARAAASYNLIDPGSVSFRSTRAYRLQNGDIAWCGERNARNRFGGFVGFKPFYVRFDPMSGSPAPTNEQIDFIAQNVCGALARGQSIPIREG